MAKPIQISKFRRDPEPSHDEKVKAVQNYAIELGFASFVDRPDVWLEIFWDLGILDRFETGGRVKAPAYVIPLGPHKCVWHKPEVKVREHDGSEYVRLFCAVPGCRETKTVELEEAS